MSASWRFVMDSELHEEISGLQTSGIYFNVQDLAEILYRHLKNNYMAYLLIYITFFWRCEWVGSMEHLSPQSRTLFACRVQPRAL